MNNNIFEDVMYNNVPRNSFDLSHDRKFSAKLGRLYPCLVQEIVPGDSFSVQSEQLIRMAPLVSPVMHRVTATTHYFFVPNRLLWEGWEDFITNPLSTDNPAPSLHLFHKQMLVLSPIIWGVPLAILLILQKLMLFLLLVLI